MGSELAEAEAKAEQIAATKAKLKSLLIENDLKVLFIKADGTERFMRCTLQESKLPVIEIKEGEETKPKRKESPDVLAVFDLDVGDWRSFRIDRLKDYEIV